MGIFLNFTLAPSRISPTAWDETYKQALQIAGECELMDRVISERNRVKYGFARITAERDLWGKGPGFCVVGTMDSGFDMEEFVLFRSLDYYKKEANEAPDNGVDILLYDMQNGDPENEGIPAPNYTSYVWGGKTQGRPGHIPLLAIACLFADRFPDAVTVSGDITAGQCNTAVRLVKECLDIDIQPPARCIPDVLAKRLQAVEMPEHLKLRSFFHLYLGSLTEEVGKVLRDTFGEDALYAYFRGELAKASEKTYSMSSSIRDYLLLGLDFPGLLRMMVSDEQGCRMPLETVLEKFFSYNIHVPMDKKNSADAMLSNAVTGDSDGVSSIEGLFGRMFFTMMNGRNKNLPVYVPLDTIRASCRPLAEDSDALIDRLLKEKEPDERQEKAYGMDEESAISQLVRAAEEKEAEEKEREKYDIKDFPDLRGYTSGATFEPEFEKDLLKCIRHIQGFDADGSIFAKLSTMDREGRETWFLRQNRYLLLRETMWDHIFSHIMDDEYIHRYLQLFLVDCSNKSCNELMSPLMCSPELVDLLWEKALAGESCD